LTVKKTTPARWIAFSEHAQAAFELIGTFGPHAHTFRRCHDDCFDRLMCKKFLPSLSLPIFLAF
jgi:hypothetical protein